MPHSVLSPLKRRDDAAITTTTIHIFCLKVFLLNYTEKINRFW